MSIADLATTCFAVIHLGLGETMRALDWLEKGVEQRDLPMTSLNTHPLYEPLHGEPRFEAILRTMQFTGPDTRRQPRPAAHR